MKGAVRFCTLANFACFGFIWRRIGTPATRTEIVAQVLAPHSSFIDANIVVLMGEVPYAVSRAENLNVPFIGSKFLSGTFSGII